MRKIALSFSGKDSVLALYQVLQDPTLSVKYLIATVNQDHGRSSMHGIRETLLDAQAKSLGFELKKVYIPKDCTHEMYQSIMGAFNQQLLKDGIQGVVFGDLLLEDVKQYREKMLQSVGLEAIFPLWGKETKEVVETFIHLGFKTLLCCIDLDTLPLHYLGKHLDLELYQHLLAEGVDPAGENGEYHSFVFDGPLFQWPINITLGQQRLVPDAETGKDRFCFIDVLAL